MSSTQIQDFVVSTGIITPSTSTLKGDVQSEYKSALGSNLSLDDATPQGRLIDMETSARANVLQINADIANQINPNVATGSFLAAIGALSGIAPVGATFSTVPGVVLSGKFGTIIPIGSRVADLSGNKFATAESLVIGHDGTVTTTVKAVTAGFISVGAGELTTIVDGALGWESVNNPTANAGFEGTDQQTDAEFRLKRKKLLAKLGKGGPEAIISNVSDLDGVNAVAVRENPSGAAATIDGVVLPPYSTWTCVDGGTTAEVAAALHSAKQQGSPWTAGSGNGTAVTTTVTDKYSGQNYSVTFARASEVPCACRVTVSQGTSSAALMTEVPEAILSYADGELENFEPLVQGVDVSPFEIAAAISAELPGVFVKKVEVSFASPISWTTSMLDIAMWEKATFASGNITVVVS